MKLSFLLLGRESCDDKEFHIVGQIRTRGAEAVCGRQLQYPAEQRPYFDFTESASCEDCEDWLRQVMMMDPDSDPPANPPSDPPA